MLTLPRCVAVTLLTAVATLAQIPTGPQTRVFQDGVSGGASGVTQAAVIHDSGGDGSVTEGATLTLGSGRALIGFPRVLGTGPDQVTPGANISSATLEVWVESVPGAAATRTLTLLPLFDISGQGPWHEPQAPVTNASGAGVSWLSRDGRPGIGAPWLIAGGDAAVVPAPYSATATVDQTPGQWVSFDVTTVAGLIAEGWSNLGWSLDSDQPGDDVVLSSDEATDPTRRPRLTVNWSSLVVGANDVPAADDHQLTTTEGAPVLLQLPFVDGDGQLVQYVIREWPQNGTLEGQTWWVYKPAPGFIGTDTFTYYAHDGFASSPIGTVTITVGPDAAATTSTYASGAAGTAGEVRSATIPVTSSPTGQVTNVGPEIVVAQGSSAAVLDLPGLLSGAGAIPAGATIVAAQLELTATQIDGIGPRAITAWRLLDPGNNGAWHQPAPGIATDAGVSWLWRDARPTELRPWLVPGGARASGSSTSATVDPSDVGSIVTFDVTAAVAAWINGEPNHGWILEAGSADDVRFASESHGTISSRPRLVVTWRAAGAVGSNLPPVADAGPDRTLVGNEISQIDGSSSYDPEGLIAGTLWYQTGGPQYAIPNFGADLSWEFQAPIVASDTTFTFVLGVQDTFGHIDFDAVDILVRAPTGAPNAPPVVAISPGSATANEGTWIILSANASYDPEGAPITGTWTQVSGPPMLQSVVVPTAPVVLARLPFITAAESPVTVGFRVDVTDGTHTTTDWKTVQVLDAPNSPPIVALGPNQSTESGRWVGLDARGTYDPDPAAYAVYTWTQLQGPPVTLFRDDTRVPYFKAPTVTSATDVVIEFSVFDGELTSTGSTTVTVQPAPTSFTGNAQSLAPYGSTITPREARHLLRRLGYSGSQALVAQIVAQGLDATITGMMNPIATPAIDAAAASLVPTPLPGDIYPQANLEQVTEWWLTYKLQSPWQNQLKEKIAYFYHDLYATGGNVAGNRERHWRMAHINLFRNDPFPNYRQFLIDLTHDDLMLDWLDNHRNQSGAPNENYAREFWELFTMGPLDPFTGLPNYTETDIQEASRAFTGWERYDPPNNQSDSYYSRFNQSRHDPGMKTVLGFTGPWKDEEIVDITLTFPQAAEFICMNLFRFFAHDNPSYATVQSLAQTLTSNGWEIAPVVERIVESEAMFSPEALKNRIKTPTEFILGFMRETGLDLDVQDVYSRLADLGHLVGQPPNVKGWNDNESWLGEAAMAYRGQAINEIIEARAQQAGFDFGPLLPAPGLRCGPNAVSHLLQVLDIDLEHDDMFHTLVEYIDSNGTATGSTFSPFDGDDPADVDRKLRGILFVLAFGAPDYHFN